MGAWSSFVVSREFSGVGLPSADDANRSVVSQVGNDGYPHFTGRADGDLTKLINGAMIGIRNGDGWAIAKYLAGFLEGDPVLGLVDLGFAGIPLES